MRRIQIFIFLFTVGLNLIVSAIFINSGSFIIIVNVINVAANITPITLFIDSLEWLMELRGVLDSLEWVMELRGHLVRTDLVGTKFDSVMVNLVGNYIKKMKVV